ncbi:Gfo/Idh/MocA family oxidoreductase [bacterium]|nr:Gfo/Idh/MocA family oxidoreductase [bacterium]
MENRLSRRHFLRLGIAAGVAAGFPRSVRTNSSSGPTRLGFIGVGGRGTYLLRLALGIKEVEVVAICDINESHLRRAQNIVQEVRGNNPAGYSAGPKDYRRLLDREDVDAVVIATPMQLHAEMSVDSLRERKHALSEVATACTLDECWALVEAVEETGRLYMLAENCCYLRSSMMILNMVKQGVFGDISYAECGYVHDCRGIKFNSDGSLTWRGELGRDNIGNLYPTHSLGPVAQWMGINREDRLVSLVAMTTRQASIERYAAMRFGKDSPAAKVKFAVGDSTSTLIRTAKGAVIDLRYDTASARPHPTTTYYALQGLKASYESRSDAIWIEKVTKGLTWEPLSKYAKEYEHPKWKMAQNEARKTSHGGADFFPIREFVRSIREGRPSPIDVYDAVTWSSIIPLSAESIRGGGKPVEIPDFTRGKWKEKKA